MLNFPAPVLSDVSSTPRSEDSEEEKRQRWFEVCLVVLVGCGGPFLNSLYLLKYGPSAMPRVTNVRWLVAMVQEVSGLLLLGYVLSRAGAV